MSIARRSLPIIAGLAMVALVGCADDAPPLPAALRLELSSPPELVMGNGPDDEFGLALAPDGRRLVFPAGRAGNERALWLRDMTSGELTTLAGTDRGMMPFWSPDGNAIGYFADGKMRSVELTTGRVTDLAEAASPRGATWLENGDIIFAPEDDGGLSVRSRDGTVSTFTTLAPGELSHRLPQPLANDRIVFFVRATESARQGIWVTPRDDANGRRRLASSEANALVMDDTLIYSNGGALVAQPIVTDERTPRPRAQLLATTIGHGNQNQLFATVGGNVLIHGRPASGLRELRWLDRTGDTGDVVGEPMQAWQVRISPTAPEVATSRVDPQLRTLDVWLYHDRAPVPRRVSPSINVDDTPIWSPDGSRIAWVTARTTLMIRSAAFAEAAAAPTPSGATSSAVSRSLPARGQADADVTVRQFARPVRASDWSADGRAIILTEVQADGRGDIIVTPVRGDNEPVAYLRTPFHESGGVLSPDGRWMAYESDESGTSDVYVDRFPTPGTRARLTLGGGSEPRWSRDGTQIFFRRGHEIHAVTLTRTGDAVTAASSAKLLDAGADIRSFDVASDGQRFLVNVPASVEENHPLTVLVNVRSLLPSAP